jgi:hypothetical protein
VDKLKEEEVMDIPGWDIQFKTTWSRPEFFQWEKE